MDFERLRQQCFKSVWVWVALHDALGITKPDPRPRVLSLPPMLKNGRVVHWTLGALIYRSRFIPLRCTPQLGLRIAVRWQREVSHLQLVADAQLATIPM